jgi:epoxyqueuosine reductase
MNENIRSRARELGFDDCRITIAEVPESASRFKRWLEQGRHGEMGYLERNAHKRVDPQLVLNGARSVVVLAASYEGGKKPEGRNPKAEGRPKSEIRDPKADANLASDPLLTLRVSRFAPHGLIARYARFADYHDVLAERLRILADFVDQLGGPGTRSLWYVDTGPVLERDLGQRAGLGFIGKHTNLISRRLGNWFFLSEIITTAVLEPDEAERNRCGSCTRCLAACPTGAITAPFELDARRCISYLTIENKGAIPIEWRRAIGNRIYGCDDCLEACPWNRFAREGRLMSAQARPDLADANLLELLSLDEAGFKRRFAGTPILRAKRRGLLRNVCVALGNSGDLSALPALRRAADDSEPLIAEHARWAIAQIEAISLSLRASPSSPSQ